MQTTFTTTALTTLLALATASPLHMTPAQGITLSPRDDATTSGSMTYYSPAQGSCGVTNTDTDLVVAVASSVYGTYANPNASPACGQTATITCGSTTVTATVRDRCAGCAATDIDVSPAVFEKCGDLSVGKMAVSWKLSSA